MGELDYEDFGKRQTGFVVSGISLVFCTVEPEVVRNIQVQPDGIFSGGANFAEKNRAFHKEKP